MLKASFDDYVADVFWGTEHADSPTCWYGGPECDGGLDGLRWDRARLHLVCTHCQRTEGHDE